MSKFNINDSLGFYLSKAYILFREAFNEKINRKFPNLTSDHWSVLVIVNNKPGVSQTEISDFSFRDKSSITRIIDFMEKEQMLERRDDKKDRRTYNIYLAPKGQKIYEDLLEIAEKLNVKVLNSFKETDILKLKEMLKGIINQL